MTIIVSTMVRLDVEREKTEGWYAQADRDGEEPFLCWRVLRAFVNLLP